MITHALIGASFSGRVDYDQALAQNGFDDLDIPTTVVRETVDDRHVSAEVMLVDSIRGIRSALRKPHLFLPPWLDYPPELAEFYGRKVWKETWGELNQREGTFFVKRTGKQGLVPMVARFPFWKHKQDPSIDGYGPANLGEDTELLVSEPVRFLSEWRAFVIDGGVVDVRKYRGDWSLRPQPSVVEAANRAFRPNWGGYCIDFGVTDDARTLVVETNAGYSLGAYGLAPELYARLLMAAWPSVWGAP